MDVCKCRILDQNAEVERSQNDMIANHIIPGQKSSKNTGDAMKVDEDSSGFTVTDHDDFICSGKSICMRCVYVCMCAFVHLCMSNVYCINVCIYLCSHINNIPLLIYMSEYCVYRPICVHNIRSFRRQLSVFVCNC